MELSQSSLDVVNQAIELANSSGASIETTLTKQLFDEVGYPIVLDIEKKWEQIRILRNTTDLFSEPNGSSILASFSQGHVFAVLKTDNGWCYVESVNQNNVIGWVKADSFEPILE